MKLQKLDYAKLKFKCGIEIHQQLNGKKLFCDSPTQIRDDEPHFTVQRKLRAVIGESGEIDTAAISEMKQNKVYTYQGYTDTTGLVEIDEEPPHVINSDALGAVLQVAKMLRADIVDEVQIMRKTVVDGSNTSGFQRTALVGLDGHIKTESGQMITIPNIIIEEDACKIVKKDETQTIYNLSRLGIPLIELGTGPDITSPIQAQEVAKHLGMILRSTGKVKRGLGTIRQDLNVSILNGNRVEIKGAQDLGMIPTIIDFEIIRQLQLQELHEKLQKVSMDVQPADVTKYLLNTKCGFIAKRISQKKVVYGLKLQGLNGIIGQELQPKKRLGTDFSDFAKIHAGVTGLIHSDEDFAKYEISTDEITSLQKALAVQKDDAFVLVVDTESKAQTACYSVLNRIDLFVREVIPKEVRKANPDGTSSYMRPMPSSARMYPETDTIPIIVQSENIELPELIDDKIKRFSTEYNLSLDLASDIVKGDLSDLFEICVLKFPSLQASFIAESVNSIPKILKRKYSIEYMPTQDEFIEVFTLVSESKIANSSLIDIFVKSQQDQKPVLEVAEGFLVLDKKEVEQIVNSVLEEHKNAPMGLIMGKIMAQTKGRADGKFVKDLIGQKLK